MFKGLFAEMFANVFLLLLLFVQHSEFNSGWRMVLLLLSAMFQSHVCQLAGSDYDRQPLLYDWCRHVRFLR